MSDDKMLRAKKLIQQKRYDVAVHLLRDVDDPRAQALIARLKTMKPKRNRSVERQAWLAAAGLVAMIVLAVVVVLLLPDFIERVNEARPVYEEDFYSTDITEEEIVYVKLNGYCSQIVRYGVEWCMDWTDLVLEDYEAAAMTCLDQFDPLLEAEFPPFHQCVNEKGLPPPFG